MDAFALLEEPRRPWLDAAALKEKFLSRSAEPHPDKFTDPVEKEAAQTLFADLNRGHETLRDPKQRLQHLLTHERGEKPADVHDMGDAVTRSHGRAASSSITSSPTI